jgi:hypothetical protein
MFCAACGMVRPIAELLAFWPAAQPALIRFVCRPSLQRTDIPPCFRERVGPAGVHAIALAVTVVPVAA